MKKSAIFLDYNATAPLRPCARESLINAHDAPLNASSIHSFGRQGRKLIEDARQHISHAINCPAAQITFNSGATEGNNTILHFASTTYPKERILISAIEHPSLYDVPNDKISIIPVDNNGIIKLDALEDLLKDQQTSLVSIMLANNETGVIQPIKDIAAIVHKHGALLHCDATQALGRIPVDMEGMNIDAMTVSSHKIGGPQGVGALAIGLCGIMPVMIHGGGQEKKLRAGTENVAGIAAFGAAINEACSPEKLTSEHKRLSALQRTLEQALIASSDDITIHATGADRLPNTTLFSLYDAKAESILMAFDLAGIAVSNGSACSSGTVKMGHVMEAMGASCENAKAAIRISTGWDTTEDDVQAVITEWQKIAARQKR